MYSPEHRAQIDTLVEQWVRLDPNEETRKEILDLQRAGKYDILDSKLLTRIAFGTAGLRSSMQLGFAHMNDVTIMQASQGLVAYLEHLESPSIVVGYDHRFHSHRFAEITASVALTRGFTVYYLGGEEFSEETSGRKEVRPEYVHTPLVPFSIDHYGASAGVMVTASHNPAQDNGYKVYYGNGCQIIPPHDDGIAASIGQNLEPWPGVWGIEANFKKGVANGKLVMPRNDITSKYVAAVTSKLIALPRVSFPFVYTPVHGVGLEIVTKVVGQFSSPEWAVVEEQARPDPTFPTVVFPNPEEKGALDLATRRADALGYKLVLATDPDADRFSVAIKTDRWVQLTGNEIGFLFAMWVIEQAPNLANTYLVNSTVSSQVLAAMAAKDGFHFQDTLTGFKWIGNKAINLKQQGYAVPFGYEEAIGYMFDVVNDKDGVSAMAVFLQLYEKWFTGGASPLDKLAQGYERYGWFKEANGYYKLDDVSKTKLIFGEVRALFEGDAPTKVGPFDVEAWRDLTVGYDSTTPGGVPLLPVDPKSHMITAVLLDGSGKVRFTCRGSGTEPKLKVYIEGVGLTEAGAQLLARRCWEVLRHQWFRPEQRGLGEVRSF